MEVLEDLHKLGACSLVIFINLLMLQGYNELVLLNGVHDWTSSSYMAYWIVGVF